jgi:phosphoglycolate phosphatase
MLFPRRIEAVIIDLDGTLVDTAPDLAAAANRMLRDLDLPPRSLVEVTSFIGKGIPNLVARCVGDVYAADSGKFEMALARFEAHYREVSGQFAAVFPGVREGLAEFHAQGLRCACMTNKAEQFTKPLLAKLGLREDFALVVSGDTLAKKKPDPLPLSYVCERFDVAPAAALVIGDSPNDTLAARAAGCPVVCVPYGYREGLEVRELDCDAIVSTLAEASSLIRNENALREAASSGHLFR